MIYDAEAFRMLSREPAGAFGFKPVEMGLMLRSAVDEAERLRAEVARLEARCEALQQIAPREPWKKLDAARPRPSTKT